MSKTITIDDDAYRLLRSLKQDHRDSFTRVILRHIRRPAETYGELLDLVEAEPPPRIDREALETIVNR
jgi:predicted CopG family antitoxin